MIKTILIGVGLGLLNVILIIVAVYQHPNEIIKTIHVPIPSHVYVLNAEVSRLDGTSQTEMKTLAVFTDPQLAVEYAPAGPHHISEVKVNPPGRKKW